MQEKLQLLPQNKAVCEWLLVQLPVLTRVLLCCVCSLPMSVLVFSGRSGFLQSPKTCSLAICDSTLSLSMSISINGCVSLYVTLWSAGKQFRLYSPSPSISAGIGFRPPWPQKGWAVLMMEFWILACPLLAIWQQISRHFMYSLSIPLIAMVSVAGPHKRSLKWCKKHKI